MQVLEGDKNNVAEIYAKIEGDTRHKKLDVLRSEHITERNFPDWSMGFTNLRRWDLVNHEGFVPFLDKDFRSPFFKEHSIEAHALLLYFKNDPQT